MLEGFRRKFLFGLVGFECVKTCSGFFSVTGGHVYPTDFPSNIWRMFRKIEHLLKWAFCLKHSPFSPFFFTWYLVGTIGKREENLTMVLHSLQPLAIGFTTPCTLLPCTGPYFAKCPSIASSFSLEGQNIVRSFLSEGHVDLFFI
jgi:hypothetical protein